jgi:fatty-acyl-CoA synthase
MIGRSFGSVLDACAHNYPRETALVQGDVRLSYTEMFGRIRQTGRALQKLGLGPGDRLAFVMADSPALLEVMYGALWAGITTVPLNARLSLEDHKYMIEDAQARALVFDASTAERGHELLAGCAIEFAIATDEAAVPERGELLERLIARQDGGAGAPAIDPDGECLIQYTGGTTGFPKGVLHSHRTLLASLYSATLELDVRPGEVSAHIAPLTHSGMVYVLPVWARGGTNVVLGGFDPSKLLHTIEHERVTSTLMVPTMLYFLLDLPGIADRDLSSLRTLTYGAAPMGPERIEQALDVFGPIFIQVYGQSEAPAQITVLTKRDHVRGRENPDLLRSCGRPVTIVDVRCADDALASVPDGEPGEILVRGPNVTLGYINKPEETAAALRDGWLCTGDIGVRDEQGYFYIVDRKKDMIVSGGFNVYPKEVEQTLFGHPAVRDVCVVGVPDEKWGEAVKAVVVVDANAATTSAELIEFVKEHKGSVLAPKSVDFVDAIPLTSIGKHDKKALRESYWAGRERAVN